MAYNVTEVEYNRFILHFLDDTIRSGLGCIEAARKELGRGRFAVDMKRVTGETDQLIMNTDDLIWEERG